uniref:Uncharacterized protein n=1 Tax=Rangifer tarandus platyrhynchus TaxID=3082113 RepID=A0ACB0EE84_RANTA|nr:unnamed protein product [Rangifer tarandus platyrhynchus]
MQPRAYDWLAGMSCLRKRGSWQPQKGAHSCGCSGPARCRGQPESRAAPRCDPLSEHERLRAWCRTRRSRGRRAALLGPFEPVSGSADKPGQRNEGPPPRYFLTNLESSQNSGESGGTVDVLTFRAISVEPCRGSAQVFSDGMTLPRCLPSVALPPSAQSAFRAVVASAEGVRHSISELCHLLFL